MRKSLLGVIAAVLAAIAAQGGHAGSLRVDPPAPFGAVPSERHLLWHEMEFYGFLHFTTNTFTGKEWGYGDESPSVFNPTDFDAEQIVGVAARAGMRGLILTCKHHDGFCLWPSGFTEHDVGASPWRDGSGDVVREISDACARHGLKFGVYLSPWDRNHPEYGRPGYIEYYRNQLRELLTGYGPVFEVWWDGANGGDGYYGGARETRHIDRSTYYGWEETTRLVRELQPDAVIFSDAGDIRWVGNERGIAGDPCWATYTPRPIEGETEAVPGTTRYWEGENGHRQGERWMPAECDVSIRPGWFSHAAEDERVKGPEELVDLYYASVGRGASLLLNLPPDRRGRIHERDEASLQGFRAILETTFGADVAAGSVASASNVRPGEAFAASNVLDSERTTYWATEDGVREAWLELRLPEARWFNVVSLREFLPLGQRVDRWALEVWRDGGWSEFASGESIGARRLWRGPFLLADRVRLRVSGPVGPALSEFALHAEPARVTIDAPADAFLETTRVELLADRPGVAIRYTVDGSEPTIEAPVYGGPITLRGSAVVRAGVEENGEIGPRVTSRAFTGHSRASLREGVRLLRTPGPGLRYESFEGGWQTLEQLREREPAGAGVVDGFDLAVRPRDEHFGLVFSGFIEAPVDGLYRFITRSDDGSRLFVHGSLIVENDGLHGMVERDGFIGLRAGLHPIRVEYFNAAGQSGLEVLWATPGEAPAPIPGDALLGGR